MIVYKNEEVRNRLYLPVDLIGMSLLYDMGR